MKQKKKLVRKKLRIISRNVLNSLLVDDLYFCEPQDKEIFLTTLKQHQGKIFDDIKIHIKEAVEKIAFTLGEPITVTDEDAATHEVIRALKKKYKKELDEIELAVTT